MSEDDGEGGRSGGGDCDAPHEVEICHRPPGNPDSAHTLCVSENAVDAHVANHGDTLGPCDDRGDGGAGGAAETGAGGGEDNRCYDDMPACRTDEDCAELCVEAICLDRCCILPSY